MTVIGLLVIVGLIYMLYGKYQRVQLANQPVATIQQIAEPTNLNFPNNYRCDGRVHCSDEFTRRSTLVCTKLSWHKKWMAIMMVSHVKMIHVGKSGFIDLNYSGLHFFIDK